MKNTFLHVYAAVFWVMMLFAQSNCSIVPWFGKQCNGPEADVWMLPFMAAPLGIPATIYVIVRFVSWTR